MFFPEDIPYLKVMTKKITLPKGEPLGKNNLIFLLTNSRKESYDMIMDDSNMLKLNYYRYYFYNLYYYGRIRGRRYIINYKADKKKIMKEVSAYTDIQMIPRLKVEQLTTTYSMFYDLSEYLRIFKGLTDRLIPATKCVEYWTFMKSILMSDSFSKYQKKYLLIDIANFKNIKAAFKEVINNPVYMIYYTLFKNPALIADLNIDILLYHGNRVLKINPSLCDAKTYRAFMVEIRKLYNTAVNTDIGEELSEEVVLKNEREEVVRNEITKSLNFTGDKAIEGPVTSIPDTPEKEDPVIEKEVEKKVKAASEKIDKVVKPATKEENRVATNAIKTDVENEIENDEEIVKRLYEASKKKNVPTKSAASSARDELLRKKQEDIVVGGMTVKELKKIDASHMPIPEKNISNGLKTTNENMKTVKFANLNKTYIDNVMQKDITDAIMSLNNKSMPIYVRSIKVKDTSNELNYIDTYTIELEDANRQRSTVTVDIPKFIDNQFLWLGGNKKLILNQNFYLPLVKTGPDTVEIVTNYNKLTITRNAVKSLGGIEKISKFMQVNEKFRDSFKMLDVSDMNKGYITTIEYDEMAKLFASYSVTGCKIMFSQPDAIAWAKSKGVKIPLGKMCIGYDKSGPIFIDLETQTDDYGETITDYIVNNASEDVRTKFKAIKTGKRLMYAHVKTMEKFIPVFVLLCFWEGFSTVLNKMDAKYRLTSQYPKDINASESVIRFKDCYFVYEDNALSSLLINGMRQVNTEDYEIAAFDTKDPYFDILKKIYGKASIASALDNTYEFTIDPITESILKDLNLPTKIVDLMIHAVHLLADNQSKLPIDQNLYRIRMAETIPAILYDSIAKNYINYKNSNGRKKFSMPRDTVIKKLLELKTVEDYSTLNPILEMEKTHTVLSKGWRGINLDDSYTPPKRSYDKSMIGTIATISSPDGSVGVQRKLTLEPAIKSVRGYVDTPSSEKDLDKLSDVNLFGPAEMVAPLSITNDDPTRVGHSAKQSTHVIPVKNASPVLISNGVEEFCRYNLSSDFVVNADEDGTVIEYDEKSRIMVVEYKSGKHRAINMAPNIVKNGGGGFYESLLMTTNLKVGDKFKVNTPLAWNKDFFQNNPLNGCRMNMGVLTKVALMSTYDTYNDATYITNKLAHDAATEMCFQKAVVVGKNSNVSFIAKVGDHIEIGSPLIQFDSSFEDSTINEMLNALSKDPRLEAEIMDSAKNNVKSKVAGVIEDIKIFSTVELDELSESLRRIVKSYYDGINKKKKLLSKYDSEGSIVKCGMLLTDTTGKVEPNMYGVIRGQKCEDSVLIEFYIKHTELLEVGSKIAMFTGLKNTICEIIPEGYESYSSFRPDEEIGSIVASNSILKRMVPSLVVTVLGNKCIVELKRSLTKIWNTENLGVADRRKQIEDLVYKFFDAMDKSGTNTKKYKGLFEPMSDAEFKTFFNNFTTNDQEYLVLDIVEYEHTLTLEDVERTAKVLKIPLFEDVYCPHITMDKDNVIVTQKPVPVGYLHVKRTQQTVMKKNGISTSIDARSAMTGQVTAADKNGRETDLENALLVAVGLDATLKELNGPRADDMYMKNEMLHDIATNGFVRYADLTSDLTNKTTLNTVNVFFLGMGIDTDLVTKGLMLPKTLRTELK